MPIHVGAYAAITREPRAEEDEFYRLLGENAAIAGLEVPWTTQLHARGNETLLGYLRPGWTVIATTIPGTMDAIAADPRFGLASDDAEGARAAIDSLAALRDTVHWLNDRRGAGTVTAIELHTAPRRRESPSSADSLARSLTEVAGWDWDGARLLIEHCDADVTELTPQKGFLTLGEEIAAIAGLPVGIAINWGRSAIELRDAERVTDHVTAAREAGVLEAIVFSGVASGASEFGSAWGDQHLPVFRENGVGGEQASLLTPDLIAAALAAAGPVPITGIKVGWRGERAPAAERAALVSRGVAAVEAFRE